MPHKCLHGRDRCSIVLELQVFVGDGIGEWRAAQSRRGHPLGAAKPGGTGLVLSQLQVCDSPHHERTQCGHREWFPNQLSQCLHLNGFRIWCWLTGAIKLIIGVSSFTSVYLSKAWCCQDTWTGTQMPVSFITYSLWRHQTMFTDALAVWVMSDASSPTSRMKAGRLSVKCRWRGVWWISGISEAKFLII